MERLARKVAIVTGAGSRADGIGNGRAIAIAMAREGASVALLDLDLHAAEDTGAMISRDGGIGMAIRCDVARAEDCRAAVDAVVRRFGRPDVLVNNVGVIGPPGTAVDVDIDAWTRTFQLNVTSMLLMARFALPSMIEGGSGSIINMASITGLVGGFPNVCYPTTKGAIIALTRAMAAQHGRQGVRVNAIAPGLVYTPYVAGDGMSDEMRASRRQATVLGTEGTAWDVAAAAVFLASEEARWITGVVLPVDAGDTAVRSNTPYVA